MNIEWLQVIVAFLLGVVLSAAVKGLAAKARSKAGV